MHIEIEGKVIYPTEEIKIEVEQIDGKKKKKKRSMEQYAPLIFEECYVKHKGMNKVANAFEIEQDTELAKKIDPTGGLIPGIFQSQHSNTYQGLHLFVMQHGFQGNSFDMRTLKNMIAIAMPEALFLCATANE